MSDSTQPIPRHPSSPDHRADGRFAPGNSAAAGRGNPHAAKVNAWRNALAEAVSPGDIREAVERLVVEAKSGEGWAIRELLDRTVGPAHKLEIGQLGGTAIQVIIRPADETPPTPAPVVAEADQRISRPKIDRITGDSVETYETGGDVDRVVDRADPDSDPDNAREGRGVRDE